MLTKMEIFTPGITTPPLPIVEQDVAFDPFQIKKIDGLGPVTASVNTTQYGSVDGEFFNGSFTPKRNIVLTIALNPDWGTQTYESLRQLLYTYFIPENKVTLQFTSTHMATVSIDGYVESIDPDLFSKDPEYQVSIICPQPYFTASDPTAFQGTTQDFSAPVDVIINYEGNVDTGFVVAATLPDGGTAFNGEFRIFNNTPTTKFMIFTAAQIDTTKYFQVSTVQGDKYVRQYPLPSGLPTNALRQLVAGSSWPMLHRGPNKIQILSATAGLNWTLTYYARYGGL